MRSISVSLPINGSSASMLAASVKSLENSARLKDSLTRPGSMLFGGAAAQFLADNFGAESVFPENFGRDGFFLAQQSQEDVLGSDVFVGKTFRFLGGTVQSPLAFLREGQIHRSRHLVANQRAALDFLADVLDGCVGFWDETGGQIPVFANQSEQQMLRFDRGAAELARLVTCEKYYSSGLFRVLFKHRTPLSFPYIQTLLYGLTGNAVKMQTEHTTERDRIVPADAGRP